MSILDKHRAERVFPEQARELRQIARTVKTFGLPKSSTDRAIKRIRSIADQIDGRAATIEQKSKG